MSKAATPLNFDPDDKNLGAIARTIFDLAKNLDGCVAPEQLTSRREVLLGKTEQIVGRMAHARSVQDAYSESALSCLYMAVLRIVVLTPKDPPPADPPFNLSAAIVGWFINWTLPKENYETAELLRNAGNRLEAYELLITVLAAKLGDYPIGPTTNSDFE